MRHRIRSHLTYANVMVTILAFIVLGGSAIAATGGNFILGKSNSASTATQLTSGAGSALRVSEHGWGPWCLGIRRQSQPRTPPRFTDKAAQATP